MGKAATKRRYADNEAFAKATSLRVSPRKLNLVAEVIRGLPVARALVQLQFSPKAISDDVRKVLQSAIANAENNHNLDVDRLVVKEAYVGKALVMKRFHARARGRAGKIQKFFSNLTIVVKERDESEAENTAKKAVKKTAKKVAKTASAESAATAKSGE